MIRLKDVAARAGVSLMTVSKVLRDAPDISIATKARVRQLANEMGYVPDALARGLRTRRSRLFGLVVPSLTYSLFGQIGGIIQDCAQELGYDLLVAQTRDDARREELCIRRLLSRRIDGLFIHPVYRLAPTASIYEELRHSEIAVVLLGPRAPFCAHFTNVEADDALASAQVTRHLLELGHRRIAFFSGPSGAPWAKARFDGYHQALRESGIELDDGLLFTAGGTAADGQRAALQMLSEAPGATAVQTVSDLVAGGAAAAFLKAGVSIPEDISIAGFGNEAAGDACPVPLTTVQLPDERLGSAATEAMLRLLAGQKSTVHNLHGQLIARASTAAPRRAARDPNPNE